MSAQMASRDLLEIKYCIETTGNDWIDDSWKMGSGIAGSSAIRQNNTLSNTLSRVQNRFLDHFLSKTFKVSTSLNGSRAVVSCFGRWSSQ